MALVQLPDVKGKMVPGSSGWYWLKMKGQDWAPVFVRPGENGWALSIDWCSVAVEIQNVKGEWGPEIIPPA